LIDWGNMKVYIIAGVVCFFFIFIGAKEITALFSNVSPRSEAVNKNQAAQDYAEMLISRASK